MTIHWKPIRIKIVPICHEKGIRHIIQFKKIHNIIIQVQ